MKALAKIVAALVLALTLFTPSLARAQAASLAKIDAPFIKRYFALAGLVRVEETRLSAPVAAGCGSGRKFYVYRQQGASQDAVTQAVVLVALCTDGALGPKKYLATIGESLRPLTASNNTSEAFKAEAKLLSGETIALSDNRSGRTFWQPVVGHGLILIPMAIAPIKGETATLLIQSDLTIDQNRDLLKHMAALLRAIDGHL